MSVHFVSITASTGVLFPFSATCFCSDVPENKRPIVAVDPGRVNIESTVTIVDGTVVDSGVPLSRKQAYHEYKEPQQRSKCKKWNAPVKNALDEMSRHTIKTTNWSDLVDGLHILKSHLNVLFLNKFNKCWERTNFDSYSNRRKCLAKANNRKQPAGMPDAKVVVGNGKFPSGKKFEKSVPVKAMKKLTKDVYPDSTEGDEYRSTQVCADCDSQVHFVYERYKGRHYQVHGLLWCPSHKCRACRFKNRDRNGAINIWRIHAGEAPPIMQRNSTLPWRDNSRPENYYILRYTHQLPPKSVRKKNART